MPSGIDLILEGTSFDCMIGLGVVIKGSTSHHHLVAEASGSLLCKIYRLNTIHLLLMELWSQMTCSRLRTVLWEKLIEGKNLQRRHSIWLILKKMDEDLVINPNWSDRRQNRCAAFRFLFQWEMNPSDDLSRDLDEFLEKLEKDDDFFAYAVELIDGVIEKKEILDSIIKELVTNWDFSRVAKADLALLRLSLYEIKYRLDVPPVVAIDEALEMGKSFRLKIQANF